jgi:predicted esterase
LFLFNSYSNLAEQIQKAGLLPRTRFIFPSADFNKDAGERAWYIPIPVQDQDTHGSLNAYEPSIDIAESLIQEQVKSGISRNRIVLGGFSQGSAITSLWAITKQKSEKDRIAGLVMIAGYVPMRGKFEELITEEARKAIKDEPLLIIHGQDDTLVAPWVMKEGVPVLEKAGFGVDWALLPNMRHNITGQAIGGLCSFLRDVFNVDK